MLAATVDAVTAVLQVLAFGGVVSQIDRAVEGGCGFLAASELVEQVRARGSGGLEAAGVLAGVLEQGVERGETGCGALDLGGDGGERDAAAERRRDRVQHAVQVRVPQRRVLVGQRDETSVSVQTRRGARR